MKRSPLYKLQNVAIHSARARISWREKDGYQRFCHKVIKAPRPRNSREVTTLRLALESLTEQPVACENQLQ